MYLEKKLSKIFIKILIVYSFVGLVFIVYNLSTKNNKYNITNDKYNGDVEITYNNSSIHFSSDKNNNDISKYIKCYEYPLNEDKFSKEMKDKLDEIYNLFSNPNFSLAFAYEDMYTGLHISYNENQQFFTASTIKAPVETYLYEQAEINNIDLESYITYLSNYYLEGSGSIQFQPVGTQYKLRDLVKMSLVESDNIAYQMTAYSMDYDSVKKFWNDKGANTFWESSIWGNTTAHDGVIFMKELYNYSLTDTELSNELVNHFYNSVFRLIKSDDNTKLIHKSGWHFEIIHDMAVIYDEYPYVLAILSNRAYADYEDFFNQASKLISEFHHLYWKNKADICFNQVF